MTLEIYKRKDLLVKSRRSSDLIFGILCCADKKVQENNQYGKNPILRNLND